MPDIEPHETRPAAVPELDLLATAETFLGQPSAAGKLQSLVDTVARMQRQEALAGRGSAARKKLTDAGQAAGAFARMMRSVDLLAALDALGVKRNPRPAKNGAIDVGAPPIITSYREFEALLTTADRLSRNLKVAATKLEQLDRGQPRTTRILDWAVEALEAVWREHWADEPTRSQLDQAFGGLAIAVLTRPPCKFTRTAVVHAVERRIPASRGAAAERRLPSNKTPRAALIVSLAPNDKLVIELAHQYAEEGTQVTLAAPGGASTAGTDPPGLNVVNFGLLECGATISPTGFGRGRFDVVVFAGLAGPSSVLPTRAEQAFDKVQEADFQAASLIPARVHGLLARLLSQGRLRRGAHVVVVGSPFASITAYGGPGLYATRTVMTSLVCLVRQWARDLREAGIRTAYVFPNWGRMPDGEPAGHSHAFPTAKMLRETIARLDKRGNGCLLDLGGGIVAL